MAMAGITEWTATMLKPHEILSSQPYTPQVTIAPETFFKEYVRPYFFLFQQVLLPLAEYLGYES